MAKAKKVFVCQDCGHESIRWVGKCPSCNQWNTMVEEIQQPVSKRDLGLATGQAESNRPVTLAEVSLKREGRESTGLDELDRVLGGGVVSGSLILIGGDPGIGKSTLILQICESLGKDDNTILYVSGEESTRQIKMRANRLGVESTNLKLLAETSLDMIMAHVESVKPKFLMIDSIQTMYNPTLSSASGSVSQVREVTSSLMRLAKRSNMTIFLVGHVTKEGAIAGPRVLEHMVDTVLYFEGDRHHTYRILRGVKNRFGSTNEIGIFEMTEKGLLEIINPSEHLLSERSRGMSGSAVLCSIEGTRPMMVEIQALVSTTAFGMPRRMATGIDHNRVVLLMAVLEKKVGMRLYDQDAYINVAGGIKIDEPAADLAVVCAIASSFRNTSINHELSIMGEVGLTGEVRGISQVEKRILECRKLGFKTCIIPKANLKGLNRIKDIKIIGVDTVAEALEVVL
ncbi:MAG: DNA repair protein RadA [Clostridiales bacterium]|nr:DNA repair protein RadA [Clostridiales bacterium]